VLTVVVLTAFTTLLFLVWRQIERVHPTDPAPRARSGQGVGLASLPLIVARRGLDSYVAEGLADIRIHLVQAARRGAA
jgi:hypothetical protein